MSCWSSVDTYCIHRVFHLKTEKHELAVFSSAKLNRVQNGYVRLCRPSRAFFKDFPLVGQTAKRVPNFWAGSLILAGEGVEDIYKYLMEFS